MKTLMSLLSNHPLRTGKLFLLAFLLASPVARAGLTLSLQISHGYGYYYCYPSFYTNSTLPTASQGGYVISSPTNAWSWAYQLTTNGMSSATYIHNASYGNFDSFVNQLTNGNWTILFTNAVTTNLYTFTVSATGLDSNSLPNVAVTYPMDGSANIPNNPTFTWVGPTNWGGYLSVQDYNPPDYSFFVYGSPLASQTNWTFSTPLTNGPNEFYLSYQQDASTTIVATQPLDGSSQPIAGWNSTASLNLYAYSDFTVTNLSGGGGSGGHTLVARYTFDDGSSLPLDDSSGNGNNINSYSFFGGGSLAVTTDAKEGAYAIAFNNNGGAGAAFYAPTNTSLHSVLSGSFSISLWLKTTQVSGSDTDNGMTNTGIISSGYGTVAPMLLTGSKLAFLTDSSSLDTLHSATSVNTGNYVHVVVTRDQATGEKKIYVNGVLDASDVAETGALSNPNANNLVIGYNNGAGYNGEMDDIQIYSGVLSAADVSYLYNNPGTTITNTPGGGNTPVSVSFDLQFNRERNFTSGGYFYYAFPNITAISPAPVTTNSIVAPDGVTSSEVWAGDSSQDNGAALDYSTLDDLIYAFTNGQWMLYINKGDPSEQVFHFNVSISGLTSNLLADVNVLVPTNNAVNVATNSPFQWSGPTNFSSVYVYAYQIPSYTYDGVATLPGDSTNWPSPPALVYGTNIFYVSCTSNNFPGVSFTTPVDGSMNPVASWSATADISSHATISFVVGAPAPLPVLLSSSPPHANGGNFQLSFQTLAGRPETIQVTTNLASGVWTDVTNFTGDGSTFQLTVPTTNSPGEYFRVETQ